MLKLGTRGSALALWQANMVAGRLHAAGVNVEIIIIRTTGDARQDVPLPAMAGKGVFVREIEAALLRGEIDLAAHSAKDLQSVDPEGLTLAAFCERHDPRDALIAPSHGTLDALPQGAMVATGSPRRVAQLRYRRPDLRFVEIRGNVDTRLEKLARGDADALVLAVAGLERLGRGSVITERLPVEFSLPQVGQGCVAVQCRAADADTVALIAGACDHSATREAVTAERAFLSRLGGGCTAPVAAHAWPAAEEERTFRFAAFVGETDGARVWRVETNFLPGEGERAAESLYNELIRVGALDSFGA